MSRYPVAMLLASLFSASPGLASPAARVVAVQDSAGLAAAIADARPGDDIVLADGVYPVSHKILADGDGTSQAPITVRAAHRGRALIRSAGVIAFEVTGSYWSFADLDLRGVCLDDTTCEHAFHVVGGVAGFRLTGSRLADFNAHIKVNANEAHALPRDGLVEGNEFFDTHPRHTGNPVAPINIDNAIAWTVRGNLIHDFQKDGTGEGSYGAFVKGGSQRPIVERNLVFCARDAALRGQMVGLSLGAHGMDAALCPPLWDTRHICDPEVEAGIVRNNIVVNCNDDGIYLNRAHDSAIVFNTLVQTGGITFRFPGSTGVARGNLMMSTIRGRDGGSFVDGGNVTGVASARALADWFKPAPGTPKAATAKPMLGLPGPDPRVADDYCGRARGATLDMGAMQATLGDCPLWR